MSIFRNSKSCKSMAVVLSMLFLVTSFVCFLIPSNVVNAERIEPTRVINVVYDDSGSMYSGGIDRWSKALYSLEVFAAMLGENDTMNVYFMSNYDDGDTVRFQASDDVNSMPGPAYTLRGSAGAAANVSTVHNFKSKAGNTPFAPVNRAMSDLASAQADEKWLVVLTDGEFEHIEQSEIDSYVYAKPSDISVVCLALASGSMNLPTPSDANHIYVDQVGSSDSILEKITEVITRVFNSTKLSGVNGGSVTFNLPMSELIVFAQGENAQLSGQISNGSDTFNSVNNPVTVRHTDSVNVTNSYQGNQPDTSLNGQIAIFRGAFDAGTYNLGVSGAADNDVVVFYKPDVEVTLRLTDAETGEEIVLDSTIEPGTYNYEFVFVRTGTDEVYDDITLLGDDISYYVTMDGVEIDTSTHTIEFTDGTHDVLVAADFLTYNHVEKQLHLNVVTYVPPTDTPTPTPDPAVVPVTFEVTDGKTYEVNVDSVDTSEPITVHAMLDGREFTAAEWEIMELPTVELTTNARSYRLINIQVEKGSEIGDFLVTFEVDGTPGDDTYDKAQFRISCEQVIDEWTTWAGSSDEDINFSDARSWWDRYKDKVAIAVGCALALLLICMYMPFWKHYLPKMNKNPEIEIYYIETLSKGQARGTVTKNILSTIIPIVAQRGTIDYSPARPRCPAPPLEVKALGGGAMEITNAEDFTDRCPVTVGASKLKSPPEPKPGEKKKRKKKTYTMSASSVISSTYRNTKIKCRLNTKSRKKK